MHFHINWVTLPDFVRSIIAALGGLGVVTIDNDVAKAIVGVVAAVVVLVTTFVKSKSTVTSVAVGAHPRSYDER